MKKTLALLLALAMLLTAAAALGEAASGEQVITVSAEKWDIPVTICMPEGDGPFPLVVMYHGTGSSRDEAGDGYKMLAPKLAEAGIASARFDFVGNGDSTGSYQDYTLTSGVADGDAVIAYLQGTGKIDPERIGMLGWSQGGTVAMLAASGNPAVKSLVTWAGAVDMSFFNADLYDEAKANGFAVMNFDWREPLEISSDWFEEVRTIKIADELKNYKGAVLAIAGSLDDVVPLTDLDLIVESAGGEQKEKFLLEGADHTFNVFSGDLSAYETLAEKTVSWFKDTL